MIISAPSCAKLSAEEVVQTPAQTPPMLKFGSHSFLLAFRRFVALKNKPNCFYSDNALTFKSADNKLKALLGKGMDPVYNYAYYETAPVQWEFSTATAPWTNGVTELMVGIFKKQFKIVMQKRMFTVTEMDVIIIEIVSFVNE